MTGAAVEGLAIEVDEHATTATRVVGVVRGRVTRACRCDGLRVTLVHRGSYPRGFRELREERARQEVAAGSEWPAGHELAVPFELAAPGFPPTYRGALVSASWQLELELRVAGDVAATCARELPVTLAADAGVAVLAPLPARAAVERVSARAVWSSAAAVAVVAALVVAGFRGDSWLAWPALVVLAAALFALLGFVVQWRNERRMGDVQLGFEADGDGVPHCVVWTRADAPPAAVRVELVATEVLYTDVRARAERKRHEEVVVRHALALAAAAPGTYRAPVPRLDAPFTMSNGLGSGVAWHAHAVVTAPAGVHVERRRALEVRPARGPGSRRPG